ncbi:MAG: putative toxin-antitoxin system toxin component, PIN family [Magnetococcales bacterium]|nr:putative toxin-antitoxin system toxin component, PIN family [Magnetococcales bacterium]MBF0156481.1 putative toxin-antitoxin system toxin component, PIN family [Magnetococcales bacterium]
MKVVLDTNVLVAGLRSSNGASHCLLQQLPMLRMFYPQISVPLFLEYEAVLKRPDSGIRLEREEIDIILDVIAAVSNHVKLHYLWRPMLPDPADDMILELAVASNAEAIVTFNTKDFAEAERRFGIRILTPREFWLPLLEKKR